MTWTPPPKGTPPRPIWSKHLGLPSCDSKCPWFDPSTRFSLRLPCTHHNGRWDGTVCYPATIEMRAQLHCARRRAEAWHKAARKYRSNAMLRVYTQRLNEHADRIRKLEAALRDRDERLERVANADDGDGCAYCWVTPGQPHNEDCPLHGWEPMK